MTVFNRLTERTEHYIRSYVIGKLLQRRAGYRLLYRNDMEALKRVLRPGDIILVEGNYWVSDWIKMFSYHTWTHCVMWVGNTPAILTGTNTDCVEEGGNIVESLMTRGVVLTNLDKYRDFNLRICRPTGISREALRRAVAFVLEHIGAKYDEQNITQFVHFTFANEYDPTAPAGQVDSSKYTCSSLLAAAFDSVGFPTIQFYDHTENRYVAYHHTHIQPKDFDLSLNFQIIKTPALLAQMEKGSVWRRLQERFRNSDFGFRN
jgi:hypothetical protein